MAVADDDCSTDEEDDGYTMVGESVGWWRLFDVGCWRADDEDDDEVVGLKGKRFVDEVAAYK